MSHTTLSSPHLVACGPLHSLQSGVRRIKHTIVVFLFSLSSFSPLVLLHYYSNTTKNISLSLPVSPVGPILLVEPQPKTVDVDSDVTLNCKWAGNPPLTLTWFKKGSNMVRSYEPTLCTFPLCSCLCTIFTVHAFISCIYKSFLSALSCLHSAHP